MAVDNVYTSGVVKPIGELSDWFDFLSSQEEEIKWKQLLDKNFNTWLGGMHDRNTVYVKDILFKSGKLCIVCDIKNANDVIKAMQKMTNDIVSSLLSEHMAEMCGILGYIQSRNPQEGTLWQYTKTGIKKTPIDIFVPSELDTEEIQQFMADIGKHINQLPMLFHLQLPFTRKARH